jgi:hypothetical protein
MTTTKEKPKTTLIKLENVRLSYPQLWEAKASQIGGQTGKAVFQATLLLDKTKHAAAIKKIESEIARVALDKFGKKVPLKHVCLRDGAEKETEGYGDDVMFVIAKSETRVPVVDRDMSPLVKEDGKPYAGCYVNACISLYAYSHPTGGKGVSASLNVVQFVKDGESFGFTKVKPEDVFTVVEGGDDVDSY